MKATHKSYVLIENILQLIERFGVDNAIKKIKSISKEEGHNDIFIAFITTSVCNHYKITKEELLIGNSRRNQTRVQALSILCFLLYLELDFSQNDISILVGKDKTRVCRYINNVRVLDPNLICDKEFYRNKTQLHNKVKRYIKQTNGSESQVNKK